MLTSQRLRGRVPPATQVDPLPVLIPRERYLADVQALQKELGLAQGRIAVLEKELGISEPRQPEGDTEPAPPPQADEAQEELEPEPEPAPPPQADRKGKKNKRR